MHTPALTSDREARQRAVNEITKLTGLASAIHEMIEEEQKLIAHAIPYASRSHSRAMAALCRAAYAVFESDDLHEMAIEYDPDFLVEDRPTVLCIDERFGPSKSWTEAA